MGTGIDQEEFGKRDYARFAERLEECLTVLGQLLNRPGFGTGPVTIGAELELFLEPVTSGGYMRGDLRPYRLGLLRGRDR
jgi:hypothetical protein